MTAKYPMEETASRVKRRIAERRSRREVARDLPFDLFEKGTIPPISDELIDQTMAQFPGVTREAVEAQLKDVHRDDIWFNSRYQVNMRDVEGLPEGWPPMIALSIKRRDRERIGPEKYRDFMAIKDRLIGPEHEAVELYPARSREYDTANQYHLYVMKRPGDRWPFGFDFGQRVASGANTQDIGGWRQHPFDQPHHVYGERR